MSVVAVILAAGKGQRFGRDKLLEPLLGRPLWQWSFDTLRRHPEIDAVGVVASAANFAAISERAAGASFLVEGGEDRRQSALAGIKASPEDAELVLIHDAARPFVSPGVVSALVAASRQGVAAAPAVPLLDTIREAPEPHVTLDRDRLLAMQTPQAAPRQVWMDAHGRAAAGGTDDLALVQQIGHPIRIVPGHEMSFKVTTAADLTRARAMLSGGETRTGFGYDVHAFADDPDRPLWLGGVRFEGAGLVGHSDADVVIHAAVDALLGAVALGDIGEHFPDSDPRWRDEPSSTFLRHAAELLAAADWHLVNLDLTVVAERPRIMSRSMDMRAALASDLGTDPSRISIKATTNEGLGSIGRGEGIAAFAAATVCRAAWDGGLS